MPRRPLFRVLALLACALSALAADARPARAQDAATPVAPAASDLRQSVVKIFSTIRQPDLTRPWTKARPQEVSGSGMVIPGNRILTNAHVVRHASQVFVRPHQSSDKLEAKVVAIAPGIDLALLQLEDESFFETHPPVVLADELPAVGSKVSAYGYPVGGDALSITEGVVSRIEFADYNLDTLGLRIQVDAALNPGNSGGPAFVAERMIGVVFSRINNADNIGYLIPIEEVRAFLDHPEGLFRGRPRPFEQLQTLENPALRARLGLTAEQTGLLVTDPQEGSPLRAWDVLTAVGPHDIDNTGMVAGPGGLRLQWGYYVPRLTQDGGVPVTVVRDGQEVTLSLPVAPERDRLLRPLYDRYPSYFIHGPMVFTPVYRDHLELIGRSMALFAARSSPLANRLNDLADAPDHELVILASPLLPHRITKGYDPAVFACVARVNGVEVRGLRHLVEIIRDLEDDYVVFEFASAESETLVFRRDEIEAAREEILEDNGIRSEVSDDLSDAWTGG